MLQLKLHNIWSNATLCQTLQHFVKHCNILSNMNLSNVCRSKCPTSCFLSWSQNANCSMCSECFPHSEINCAQQIFFNIKFFLKSFLNIQINQIHYLLCMTFLVTIVEAFPNLKISHPSNEIVALQNLAGCP